MGIFIGRETRLAGCGNNNPFAAATAKVSDFNKIFEQRQTCRHRHTERERERPVNLLSCKILG